VADAGQEPAAAIRQATVMPDAGLAAHGRSRGDRGVAALVEEQRLADQ